MELEMTPACFDLQATTHGLLIRFPGRKVHLGEQHVRILAEHIAELVEKTGWTTAIVDLSNVECIASSALALFIRVQQEFGMLRGYLRLRGLRPYLAEVFEAAELGSVLDFSCQSASPEGRLHKRGVRV